MRTHELTPEQCSQLAVFLADDAASRCNTLDNVGLPYFDTLTGAVDVIDQKTLCQVRQNCTEGALPDDEVDQDALQILVEVGAIAWTGELVWKTLKPPNVSRYVEVPCLDSKLALAWRQEVSDLKRPERDHVLWQIKHERIRDVAVDWLEKVGRERGVKYLFTLDDAKLF